MTSLMTHTGVHHLSDIFSSVSNISIIPSPLKCLKRPEKYKSRVWGQHRKENMPNERRRRGDRPDPPSTYTRPSPTSGTVSLFFERHCHTEPCPVCCALFAASSQTAQLKWRLWRLQPCYWLCCSVNSSTIHTPPPPPPTPASSFSVPLRLLKRSQRRTILSLRVNAFPFVTQGLLSAWQDDLKRADWKTAHWYDMSASVCLSGFIYLNCSAFQNPSRDDARGRGRSA